MRCPYCDTPNDEAAELCRKCGHELPQDRGPWRGPQESSETAGTPDVVSASQAWDPAKRYSTPRPMSAFVPPARYPDYLIWSVTVLILCFPPTGLIALLCSLQVRRSHAAGRDARAYRYSGLAKLWCRISLLIGIAIYVGLFMWLLYAISKFWYY